MIDPIATGLPPVLVQDPDPLPTNLIHLTLPAVILPIPPHPLNRTETDKTFHTPKSYLVNLEQLWMIPFMHLAAKAKKEKLFPTLLLLF